MKRTILETKTRAMKFGGTETIETAAIGDAEPCYKVQKVTIEEGDFYGEHITIIKEKDYLPSIIWEDRGKYFNIITPVVTDGDYKKIRPEFDRFVKGMNEALQAAELIERYYGKGNDQ